MAIIALEIKARQILAGGREFGPVGPYLQLDGTAHFAVDPGHPGNRCFTDLDLAPHDSDGRVRFAAVSGARRPRSMSNRLPASGMD
jgi:hypothetical protein